MSLAAATRNPPLPTTPSMTRSPNSGLTRRLCRDPWEAPPRLPLKESSTPLAGEAAPMIFPMSTATTRPRTNGPPARPSIREPHQARSYIAGRSTCSAASPRRSRRYSPMHYGCQRARPNGRGSHPCRLRAALPAPSSFAMQSMWSAAALSPSEVTPPGESQSLSDSVLSLDALNPRIERSIHHSELFDGPIAERPRPIATRLSPPLDPPRARVVASGPV